MAGRSFEFRSSGQVDALTRLVKPDINIRMSKQQIPSNEQPESSLDNLQAGAVLDPSLRQNLIQLIEPEELRWQEQLRRYSDDEL